MVGFLKPNLGGETRVEAWLQDAWGKMLIKTKLINADTILMQLLSDKEIHEVLNCAKHSSSPFPAVERWMEVIGAPPRPCWVRFYGSPCMLGERKFSGCSGTAWVLLWKWTNLLAQERCSPMAG